MSAKRRDALSPFHQSTKLKSILLNSFDLEKYIYEIVDRLILIFRILSIALAKVSDQFVHVYWTWTCLIYSDFERKIFFPFCRGKVMLVLASQLVPPYFSSKSPNKGVCHSRSNSTRNFIPISLHTTLWSNIPPCVWSPRIGFTLTCIWNLYSMRKFRLLQLHT